MARKRQNKNGGRVEADPAGKLLLYKLTMHLEFYGTRPNDFRTDDFRALVDSGIRRVLGQAAPEYRVDTFEPTTMRGSLLISGKRDLHLIWAALATYGQHFEQKIALHMYSIHSE